MFSSLFRVTRVCSATFCLCISVIAFAQPYPAKPIRYIVPFPAAASPDIVARLVTEKLSRMWGQQIVVDNRSGVGGTLGAAVAAKAAPDGYTLFQCNSASSAIAEALYAKLPYDHTRDFAPIILLGKTANVLVVHPAVPARTMKEFIAWARTQPGKLSYGSSAAGTSQHLTMELLKLTFKFDVVHVAYKGAPQALTDVIGGQIPVSFQSAPGVISSVQAGRVRALGVTSLKRVPLLPDVPTLHESLQPNFEVTSWYGLCAPTGTPVAVLDKIHADVSSVLNLPDIQQRYRELVLEVAPTTRDSYGRFIAAEVARWKSVVKEAQIPLQ